MALIRSHPGRVWQIALDRPEARNAVSAPMMEELLGALRDAASDPEARIVVLTGEGSDFCAGADLSELDEAAGGPGGVEYGRAFEEVLGEIGRHPLPVLAAVRGAALGAGCQIAVACDLAVAAQDARLGIPSARLGIVINFENVQRLVLAVGPKRAAEMLFTGRTLSGESAAAWGLVNEAVAPSQLGTRIEEMAEEIAATAPLSLRGSKRGVREVLAHLSVDRETEGFRLTDFDMMAAEAFASDDLREGIRAFRERRRPEFRGR